MIYHNNHIIIYLNILQSSNNLSHHLDFENSGAQHSTATEQQKPCACKRRRDSAPRHPFPALCPVTKELGNDMSLVINL